jgi:hypothetical protein
MEGRTDDCIDHRCDDAEQHERADAGPEFCTVDAPVKAGEKPFPIHVTPPDTVESPT